MWQYVIATVSSVLVLASAVPLYVGILLGAQRLNPRRWITCAVTALAMAVAYGYIAPRVSIGPPICIFLNSMIAFICMTWATRRQACGVDVFGVVIVWLSLAVGGVALATFLSKMPSAAPYVLYAVMTFDVWIVSGTMRRLMREPDPEDSWMDVLWGAGYGVGALGITDHTVAAWSLPIYMCLLAVTLVLFVRPQRMRLARGSEKLPEGGGVS